MKYLILSCLFYLLGCSSNVQTSYTYSPAKETLVKELGLNKEASDLDVQRSLKSYFAKFNITLEFSYADGKLDVNEERLIRRLASLIKIKDIEVLKLKDSAKY